MTKIGTIHSGLCGMGGEGNRYSGMREQLVQTLELKNFACAKKYRSAMFLEHQNHLQGP